MHNNTWHIHLKGRVQGVGFRPFVFRLAKNNKINGRVYNDLDGVHIECNASEMLAREFCNAIIEQAPSLAKITDCSISTTEDKTFQNFNIVKKERLGKATLLLPPDFAICSNCKEEVRSHTNRRSNYAFTTCTLCGPRFSIIEQLPYERAYTIMDYYTMCSDCQKEYENPRDRRYHSETNSCANCGVQLTLRDSSGTLLGKNHELLLNEVVDLWKEGQIIAIKGIGGYLLTCDATNSEAVARLRELKRRPSKPFACMFPNLTSVHEAFELHTEEEKLLTNEIAPIVLLQSKMSVVADGIAPNLDAIGVMLPYTPLYLLLLENFGKPIVATSGNLSNASIIYEEEKAMKELSPIYDYILSNDRKITTAQDDSVIRFSAFKKQPILIRRSRGFAPSFFGNLPEDSKQTILAMGASQKSAFGLYHDTMTYLSQYLGDLNFFESTVTLKTTLDHFLNLMAPDPQLILIDAHPQYFSSQYGHELAQQLKTNCVTVQHHFAHFAAVLTEHSLFNLKAGVLGVIWDGAGYGADGQIWGGEFLHYSNNQFVRLGHLNYKPQLAGDKMAWEPRIAALAYVSDNDKAEKMLKEKFTSQEWKLYGRLLHNEPKIKTSSMGRLFDAVASLLGIVDLQTYEGEAALRLEALARTVFKPHPKLKFKRYDFQISYLNQVNSDAILSGVITDIINHVDRSQIAFRFHCTLVAIVEKIAVLNGLKKIAFSGGVFQNGLLVDLLLIELGHEFELYFHKAVSPNDENIALGQLAYYQITRKNEISQ